MKLSGLIVPVVIAAAAVGAAVYFRAPPPPVSQVISSPADDASLLAARDEALRTLPQFWQELDRQPAAAIADPDRFGLKLALETPDGSIENIWTAAVRRRDGRVFAKIANDPENLPNLRFGSDVEVDPTQIVDWYIRSDQGMYGHYSTRALFAQMSAEEAAQIRALLAPQPTPPHWAAANQAIEAE